jgi:phage repressor protein C with HTH and peptisase S24 domain
MFEIGDDCNIRRFYPQPGGRLRLEKMQDGERRAAIYFPGEVKIIGRVLRVDRAGVSVPLAISLRPIREGRAS